MKCILAFILSCLSYTCEATTIIVDNPNAITKGDWTASSWSDKRHGTDYLHDDNQGKGKKSARYVPELAEAGLYEVRIAYNANGGRAKKIPVTIEHQGETKTVLLNQTLEPEIRHHWQVIGRFAFDAGSEHAVTISNSNTVGHVIADAVAFVPAALAEEEIKRASQAQVIKPAVIRSFSGIYPHLASFNTENECGTGAVVPWADRLWFVTYAPHAPKGSSDKLYSVTPDFALNIHPESIGGTPANRMIHQESKQLFIGPYAIDAEARIRTIPYTSMFGRPTGNARHLFDPANKIYYASMEEAIYEVDVKTLEVTELWTDEAKTGERKSNLPGYHGKGLYSGQGRLIYANNGEHGKAAQARPDVPSGVLAEWDGKADDWTIVRRNQFTEVTGPYGIYGSEDPANDPIWTMGWDHRSLILKVLDQGEWQRYRLPKASHAYDGAHGWNTEWPRIREIGEGDNFLMTMHGMFWSFPRGFRTKRSHGITPRSSYMKIVGDFCRWGDHVVLGCDDAAKAEFLNTRKAKGHVKGPAQSQSNLAFIKPEQLSQFGPVLGRGSVWLDDVVEVDEASDAFLFDGFDRKAVHLVHDARTPVTFSFELDRDGNGNWKALLTHSSEPGYSWLTFPATARGAWIRVKSDTRCTATAWFEYRNPDRRSSNIDARFAGLVRADTTNAVVGLVRAGMPDQGLQLLAGRRDGHTLTDTGYYELKPDLNFERIDDPGKTAWMNQHVAIPKNVLTVEEHAVTYVNDAGQTFLLPIGNPACSNMPTQRVSREVATERDLFQAAGIFYELPARNAGGLSRMRPVATHPFYIHDYCSWRGLIVMTGLEDSPAQSDHIIRSEDGKAAVWLGSIDDLWDLGKPVGRGGPWKDTTVQAGVASDPFLMCSFDKKSVALSHKQNQAVDFTLEVDITGTGNWQTYGSYAVEPGRNFRHDFPVGFEAYWVRVKTDGACQASAQFEYR